MNATLQTTTPSRSTIAAQCGIDPASSNAEWNLVPASQRDHALALWRQLEARYEHSDGGPHPVPLAVTSDWVETWLDHYGTAVAHEYLILSDAEGPAGITLITRGHGQGIGPFREHTRHLGTAGETHGESVCIEHNHLLVLPAQRNLMPEQLVTYVLQDKSWETFQLDGFTEPEAQGLLAELPGFEVRLRESPYYDLRAAREAGGDPLDRLGRSTRQNVRRLLRKYGEIEFTWAETADEARDIFDELVTLHQARWRAVGQPGAFHSSRFLGFQRSLVERSFGIGARQRRVALLRARQAGRTIGCLMLLVDRNRLLDYISGFADFNVMPSPGIVTHALGIQAALARGFDAYDFLVGEKRHKANLSTDVNQLVWARWSRPSVRSRTIGMLRRLRQRWREMRRVAATTSAADAGACQTGGEC